MPATSRHSHHRPAKLPVPAIAAMLLLLATASWTGPASAQTYSGTNRIEPIGRRAGGTIGGTVITDEELREFLHSPIPYSAIDFYEAQVESLDELIGTSVATDETRNDLAVALFWSGRPLLAADMLVELTKKYPENVDYKRNLASALEGVGRYEAALDIVEEANRLDHQRLEEPEEMRLNRLKYKLNSQKSPNWELSNLHRSEFTTAFNAKKLPPSAFSSLRLRGARNTVIRELMNTLRYDPDFADAWLCMGILIEGKYNYTLAYDYYQKALSLNHPRSVEISNHVRAMGPHLPRGYTIGSLGGVLLLNLAWGIGGAILILIANWILGRYLKGRSIFSLLKRSGERRKKKWRAEDWASHHEDELYNRLQEALHDPNEDDELAAGAGGGGGNGSSQRTGPGVGGRR